MPESELKFIKRCAEFCHRDEYKKVPRNTRGIYALLKENPKLNKYDVVYIGMARGQKTGVRGRLWSHAKTKLHWTHFSVYEVWDNITKSEVEELEGLFRAIYRKDTLANYENQQKGFKKLKSVQENKLENWKTNGRN
jgi:hypothetical protein